MRISRYLLNTNWIRCLPAVSGLLFPWTTSAVGTWTRLANNAPDSVQLMLLLSDGSVMAAKNRGNPENAWYRLTPDSHGSYVNGTWTTLASMHSTRLFFSSAVLRDGRVLVAGAEYGTGWGDAEVYDPVSNTWTPAPDPSGLLMTGNVIGSEGQNTAGFTDSICKILPDGNVLVAPNFPSTRLATLVYDPVANSWSEGATYFGGTGSQNEASWVKLPDNSILTVDKNSNNSQRYLPSSKQWVHDAQVKDSAGNAIFLFGSPGSELGAALLLPNGKAFFLGGSGKTAIYTPPQGLASSGSWKAGPDIPNVSDVNGSGVGGCPDAPAAMMVNGKILCAVSRASYHDSISDTDIVWPTPTSFFEYDPIANAFTSVIGPTGSTDNIGAYQSAMLDLPDGTVLYAHQGNDLYVYQPDGMPLAAGKPTITSLSWNIDGSVHLSGTLFNGISEGAAYGDDAQMDSNYPLVRLTDLGGRIVYARTHDWSSTGVQTANAPVSTEVTLPQTLLPRFCWLEVVANGISSDPVPFYGPLWVEFDGTCTSCCGFGTFDRPFNSLYCGEINVLDGGTVAIKAGVSHEQLPLTIRTPMTIIAVGGSATIIGP